MNHLKPATATSAVAATMLEVNAPTLPSTSPNASIRALVACLAVLFLGLAAAPAAAQCQPGWLPGQNSPGVTGGTAVAVISMPNGDVVVGGSFTRAGGTLANQIARWNGFSWGPVGAGANGAVTVFVLMPNGDLIAGGAFTTIGGVAANCVARWNGTNWTPLGTGLNSTVQALQVMSNGDLVAGGSFTSAGGVPANHVARWNGTTWTALGAGTDGSVFSLALMPNGVLIAGGSFSNAGTVPALCIARWNGIAWSALGAGVDGAYRSVDALAVMPNGDLIAGGAFDTAGGTTVHGIARWHANSWSGFGLGAYADIGHPSVTSLEVMPNGDLVAGGYFTSMGGIAASRIARWNGAEWAPLGSGMQDSGSGTVSSLALASDGTLLAAGSFYGSGGLRTNAVARWNGASWSSFGPGFDAIIESATVMPNGDLIVGGQFVAAGGSTCSRIARWNGQSWFPLGSGISLSANIGVGALLVMPNGDLIAGGEFQTAGGVSSSGIARWNGASWSALGSGVGGSYPWVNALALMPNGDIIAAGNFTTAGGAPANYIARWNGTAWSPLGSGLSSYVYALAVLPNGDLVAGGAFTSAGGIASTRYIARWDGSNWSPLATGLSNVVRSLVVTADGDLIAGGEFAQAGTVRVLSIARWNGIAWSALGQGINNYVNSLCVLPNGDLVAGGIFTMAGGVPARGIARWNGAAWSPLGGGVDGPSLMLGVAAIAALPDGDLAVGGDFLVADGANSPYFARYSTGGALPVVELDPVPAFACASSEADLAVAVASESPAAYSWRKDSEPIDVLANPSAATHTLILSNVQPADAGSYDCIVTNACGSVTSNPATLTVLSPTDPACGGPTCNPDLNQDGVADQTDIDYLINAIAGGGNPNNIDTDFNHDGASDQTDVDALINVVAGGMCP